jgi:hypothetical protein
VDEVDVDPVNLGPELRQCVQLGLEPAPVVPGPPEPGERLGGRQLRERSATSSLEGQRVAATWWRNAASCLFATLTRKGLIPVGLANPSRRRGAAPAGASATTPTAPTARPAATPPRSSCRRVRPDASINTSGTCSASETGPEPSVLDDRVEDERMALPFMIRRAWYRHEHARLVRASRPWHPWRSLVRDLVPEPGARGVMGGGGRACLVEGSGALRAGAPASPRFPAARPHRPLLRRRLPERDPTERGRVA